MPSSVKDSESIRSIVESAPLLRNLTPEQKEFISSISRIRHTEKGGVIWTDGSATDYFGLVGSGFVKMVKSSAAGNEMTLELMGPGQIFGLLGVIAGMGCPLTAYGLTHTTYLRIPKAEFMEVFDQNVAVKDELLRKTALRMHQKLDFMTKLSSGSAEERLAAALLVLADSYGEKIGQGIQLNVPLTRQALAEIAGLTTETTIRVLSRWSQDDIVATDQHIITINRPDSLTSRLEAV